MYTAGLTGEKTAFLDPFGDLAQDSAGYSLISVLHARFLFLQPLEYSSYISYTIGNERSVHHARQEKDQPP